MEAGSESRLRSTLGVFGTAFHNRSLRRVELAWLAFNGAECGVWITLLVYAYTHGGAAAASLIALVQLVPCIFVAPYLGAFTDRARAGRVLSRGLLVMGGHHGRRSRWPCTSDAPPWLVFVLAPIVNLGSPSRVRRSPLCSPASCSSPLELTAANVVSGWMENGSVLVAPALGGVLLGIGGPELAIAVLAGMRTRSALCSCSRSPARRPERARGGLRSLRQVRQASRPCRTSRRAAPRRGARLDVRAGRRPRHPLRGARHRRPRDGRVRRRLPELGLRRSAGGRRRSSRRSWSRAAGWRRRSSPACSRRRSRWACSGSTRPWSAPSCCWRRPVWVARSATSPAASCCSARRRRPSWPRCSRCSSR